MADIVQLFNKEKNSLRTSSKLFLSPKLWML